MPRLTSNSVSMSLKMLYLSCVKFQELHCPDGIVTHAQLICISFEYFCNVNISFIKSTCTAKAISIPTLSKYKSQITLIRVERGQVFLYKKFCYWDDIYANFCS